MASDSEPAPKKTGQSSVPPPTPDVIDAAFVHTLRSAGLAEEMTDTLAQVLFEAIGGKDEAARHLDLLERYYTGGESEVGERRRLADRFVVHAADDPADAGSLVARLARLCDELEDVTLERIGSEDGPLVLRSGEAVAAVEADEEDGADGHPTIEVRALAFALNTLLARAGESTPRFVLLRSDGVREAYVAVGMSGAVELCTLGYLADRSAEQVIESCAW